MCGTNAGDLAAGPLGLGHVHGLLPLGLLFLAVLLVEKQTRWSSVAFYWGAVILLRTMATNIADYATHDLVSFPALFAILAAVMVAVLLVDHLLSRPRESKASSRVTMPSTNASYWIVMLAAGVFGTAL
eukprot:gene31314-35744_t